MGKNYARIVQKCEGKKQTLENCSIVTNSGASEKETQVTKNATNGQNEKVTVEFKLSMLVCWWLPYRGISCWAIVKASNWKWGTEFYVLFLIVCRVKWTFFSLRVRFCCTAIFFFVHDNRTTTWIPEIIATLQQQWQERKRKIFLKSNAPQIGSQAIFIAKIFLKKMKKWEHNALTMKKHDEKWRGIKLK